MSSTAAISIDELTAQPLPILGYSARAFRQLNLDAKANFDHYGDVILKDPGLALHTLQQLNNGSSNKLRHEVSSMAQAAMLLGMDRVQELPRGRPQLERSLRGLARSGYSRAASRAFHAAFQAWDWAHIKNDHAPEEILLATLLHDVAEMALWVTAPEKMHLLRKLIFKDHLHTDEAQYLALGDSLEHFGRQIASRWQLPSLVHDSLRPENADKPRVHGVMLAVQLGRAAERGWHSAKMHSTLEQIAEYLNHPLDETINHIHKNAVRAAHETPYFEARPAAALLPLLPGDDHILIEDEFPEVEAEPSAAPEQLTTTAEAAEVCLTPQPAAFQETVEALKTGIGNLDLNALMRHAVHGMHHGIGLNRVVFTMLSPDRRKLAARFIAGADNDPVFSRFQIDLAQPSLFTKLLEKPVSLWINSDNRDKYWRAIPEAVRSLIKTNTFYTMSVVIQGKPVGLFYADRRSVDCQLDETSYQQFRQLCQLATQGLARLSGNL